MSMKQSVVRIVVNAATSGQDLTPLQAYRNRDVTLDKWHSVTAVDDKHLGPYLFAYLLGKNHAAPVIQESETVRHHVKGGRLARTMAVGLWWCGLMQRLFKSG